MKSYHIVVVQVLPNVVKLNIMKKRFILLLFLSVITIFCGSQEASQDDIYSVRVVDDEYSPKVINIPVGGTVIWQSDGANDHNVIAFDGSWQAVSSDYFEYGIITKGDQYEYTFTKPGIYEYYCPFHGTNQKGMVGMVVVGDVTVPEVATDIVDYSNLSKEVLIVDKSGEFKTIQDAVDSASAGDLVYIKKGVYNESVTITTPYLTIRGEDRNGVIVDGEFMRENGIQIFDTDGVSVENLTVRNFSLNGVYWNSSTGYRGSYVTVHNNGDYGVYAFDSVNGIFDNIYASGHPDSGIYIGQCYPCNAVISNSVVEGNALGYSGTNAGGHLYIINNIWQDNMAGVVPNTLDSELNPPGRETTIVGNLIMNNNNDKAPSNRFGLVAYGMGMVVPGRVGDVIEKTSFDQIYDEHVFLYSALSVKQLASMHELELIDIEPQVTHGGSMRYFIAHKGAEEVSERVKNLLLKEKELGLDKATSYSNFSMNIDQIKKDLINLLKDLSNKGKKVVAYGATSKSTTVTNYFGITPDLVDSIFDTTPTKHFTFSPGVKIPVLPYEKFRESNPDYVLLFAWNHAIEIFEKEKDYMKDGKKWITYIPEVRII